MKRREIFQMQCFIPKIWNTWVTKGTAMKRRFELQAREGPKPSLRGPSHTALSPPCPPSSPSIFAQVEVTLPNAARNQKIYTLLVVTLPVTPPNAAPSFS